jgi:hypothetical protein
LRNQKESPLLRLPGELRNKIYEYAYGGMIIRTHTDDKSYPIFEQQSLAILPFSTNDLLTSTMVCRQFHSEVGVIPLLRNELCFNSITGMSTKLTEFAPKWRGKLRSVRLVGNHVGSIFGLIINLCEDAATTERLDGVNLVIVHTHTSISDHILERYYQDIIRLLFECKAHRDIKVEFVTNSSPPVQTPSAH